MSQLYYSDVEELEIVFTTLVVNIEKLNRDATLIANFCNDNNISGVTNGKLYLVAEMRYPPDFLDKLIYEFLEPKGLVYNTDMVLLQEVLVGYGDTSILSKKIPGSEKITWLGSEVRMNGNFVWKI